MTAFYETIERPLVPVAPVPGRLVERACVRHLVALHEDLPRHRHGAALEALLLDRHRA